MSRLEDAVQAMRNLVAPHLIESGCLPESDLDINNASREIVRAMRDDCGEAWLGNVNLHKRHRGEPEPVLWKWNGKLVCNFEASFVLPKYDADLERMILARADAPYPGTDVDYALVSEIHDRVRALGGVCLHWT